MNPAKDTPRIVITQPLIDAYARLSGDFNPLHVNVEVAAATPFGGTIAHGCIPMEPIFKALHQVAGTPVLPEGTTMSLRYLRPSQPGDCIHLERLDEQGTDERLVVFACVNQRGERVIEGRCTLAG
jgi:acyl dehydratase